MMILAGESPLPVMSENDLRELKSILAKDLTGLIEYDEMAMMAPGKVQDKAFSQATITGRPVWDFERRLIFLPLALEKAAEDNDRVRAVAILDKVQDLNTLSRRGELLGRLARLSLEKFLLIQDFHLDSLTRLWNRAKFMDELAVLLASLGPRSKGKSPSLENGSQGWGLSLIMVGLREPEKYRPVGGQRFPRSLVTGVASSVARAGAGGAGSSRLSEGVFAWLEPDLASREALAKLCAWAEKLKNIMAYDNRPLKEHIFGGVASFPHDLGQDLNLGNLSGAREAALELESLAGRALTEAARTLGEPFLSLAEVRAQCGRVVEVLPLSRVVIDLGLREGIQEGMTFGVLPHGQSDPEKGFKAQLIALVAGQAQTTAEILSLESPGQPVRVGDRLRILKEGTPIRLVSDHKKELTLGRVKVEVTLDNSTGLASPLSARRIARAAAEAAPAFTTLMARVEGLVHQRAMIGQKEADRILCNLAALGQEKLEPLAVIRAGVDSLSFVIPGRAEEKGVEMGLLLRDLAEKNLELTLLVGVAGYPFLDKEPDETMDMAIKALDHASFPKADPVVLFDAVSLNVSGDRFYSRGDLGSAVEEYRQALLVDPENINIINSLGACYGQMERLDEAAGLFEKAVKLAPEDYMTWFNLGQVKQRLGLLQEALEAQKKADSLKPGDFAVQMALGRLYLSLGRYTRAAEILEQADRSQEARPGLYRWLGEALARSGQPENAIRVFKKAVKANPEDAQSISWLGRLFLDQTNDKEVALSLTRQAVDLENANGLFRSRLGWALLMNDRPEEALVQFKEALNLDERSSDVLLGTARAFLAVGREEDAEKMLLDASGLAPDDQEIKTELERLAGRKDG